MFKDTQPTLLDMKYQLRWQKQLGPCPKKKYIRLMAKSSYPLFNDIDIRQASHHHSLLLTNLLFM